MPKPKVCAVVWTGAALKALSLVANNFLSILIGFDEGVSSAISSLWNDKEFSLKKWEIYKAFQGIRISPVALTLDSVSIVNSLYHLGYTITLNKNGLFYITKIVTIYNNWPSEALLDVAWF